MTKQLLHKRAFEGRTDIPRLFFLIGFIHLLKKTLKKVPESSTQGGYEAISNITT